MTVAAFIMLACVVFYIFYSIEEKAVKITNQNMDSVINNSRITRKLSTLFSDIDLLNRTFFMNSNYLESEGNRLADSIKNLTNSTANLKLKNSLLILSGNFDSFVVHGTTVNSVLYARLSLDREAHLELTVLENLISGLLIDATLAGKDTSFVTQQLTLVIGYRESLLSISKLYAELDFEQHTGSLSETASPIIPAIDDLSLRLQTISASFSEVARHGEQIAQIVNKYKQNVLDYFVVMEELNRRKAVLDNAKILSLNAMESIDTSVSRTAKKTTDNIKKIIFSYEVFVLILTFIVIIVLYLTTSKLIKFNIQNPMQAVLTGIASFSKGDFEKQITLSRNDEWGTINGALNRMALALNESYRAIQKSRDDLENRVEERTAELKQRNIELDQFAYTVSHDLKSPLVTVNGFVGLLAKDVEAGNIESAAKDMQQIVSATTKMGHLLDDLLELARVGSVINKPKLLSLNQLSDEIIFTMQGLLTESGAEIEIAPDLPTVLADKNRIGEVIQNLFENAIKFCGEGKTPKISVDAEIQGNWVQCRVKDNGIGIDSNYHDKVFGLFDRLDPGIDGTGVGLALVKRIIEVHGGKVWIESEGTGLGTQFCFTLPAAIGKTQ